MPNRLAGESSPYLLQHQNNPVDWYPWGDEAFDLAKREDKPVFLSVGYSSCHWCHVMAHESCESEQVAHILNEHFVSVKVDREERPDVDEAYMTAVQLSSGRGGWPMTLFLTPDRKPFFAGTYFPRENRGQQPGFINICIQIAAIWKEKRAEVEAQAKDFAEALREALARTAPEASAELNEDLLADAVKALASGFDNEHGGFGSAPKFPPHTAIDFLLDYALRLSAPQDMRELALAMAMATLDKMAQGGIHDHVGGGFHRYSTDEQWLLPHFEKMLYDNALMLRNYAKASAIAGQLDPELGAQFVGVMRGIVTWLLREMAAPEGYFYSALDADTEGEEGKFYTWTEAEIRDVLGDEADGFTAAFGVRPEGNYRDEATGQLAGTNVLHGEGEFADELSLLRGERDKRTRPGLDDKALIGWNGLAIAALADAGALEHAERAAQAILDAEAEFGKLPHQIAAGSPSGKAFLDDYAALAEGCLAIARYKTYAKANRTELEAAGHSITGESSAFWQEQGARLTAEMITRFHDPISGAFYGTCDDHEDLFGRTRPVFDSPMPSGNALAVRCLVATGDVNRAMLTVSALLGWMEKAPQATEALYAAITPLVPDSAVAAVAEAKAGPKDDVSVRLEPKEIKADAKGIGRGEVILSIPPGLHLNSHEPPAKWLTPTKLDFKPVDAEIAYPDGETYKGEVRIPFSIAFPTGESGAEFEVTVSYQACTETECLLPGSITLAGVIHR